VKNALVLFAFNRPDLLRSTALSLQGALDELRRHRATAEELRITVAIDGPRDRADATRVQETEAVARALIPSAIIRKEPRNRGLPSHLLDVMGEVTATSERVICIEDDVEMSPTLLLALLHESDEARKRSDEISHVIGATPEHADGSLEHQALLVTTSAHQACELLLREYVDRFKLDGAQHPNGYGLRDHAAIYAWSAAIARGAHLRPPQGTSQDRMRELAWRRAGVTLRGLPMRLVKHRGLWGQHNTPWHALRTGQLMQRLDRRPWAEIEAALIRRASQRSE
jgi:hypothetical protein